MGTIDGIVDVVTGIIRRPGRTLLTVVGTVIGVGAFIATIGASTTISQQVSNDFDLLRSTEVVVRDARPTDGDPPFSEGSEEALKRLNGVIEAGVTWTYEQPIGVSLEPLAYDKRPTPVVAASPGALAAMELTIRSGRLYDRFHAKRGENVALLGRAAADLLGITRLDNHPAIFVNNVPLTILGIIDDTIRRPEVLTAVILPPIVAQKVASFNGSQEMIIRVAPGAGELIGKQAPLALRPDQPGRIKSSAPLDPRRLRQTIESRFNTLLYTVAAIALVVGAIGIANTTLVSVLERTQEFGLRRAVGARPRHIISHVIGEAATLGAIGGTLGASIGLLVLTGIAITQGWTLILYPALLIVGPVIGATTGAAAGVFPANRARRIQPVEALRR